MILYSVQHIGNIIKAIVHKLKYHGEEEAVFIVEADTKSLACPQIANIKYYEMPNPYEIAKSSQDEHEIKNLVLQVFDDFFTKINFDPAQFKERYVTADVYNPMELFFELKQMDYIFIESVDNYFMTYFTYDFVKDRSQAERMFNTICKNMHLMDGQGQYCKKCFLFSDDSKFPVPSETPTEVLGYYDTLTSLSGEYKKQLIQAYNIDQYSFTTLLALNSPGWTGAMLDKYEIIFPVKHKTIFDKSGYFYKCIIDYYFNDKKFILKLHPMGYQFYFDYFSHYAQIPRLIPMELLYFKDEKFNIICPVQSTGLHIFEKNNYNLTYFGINLFTFFKSIHYIYIALSMFNFFKKESKKIFFYGIDEKQLRFFVERSASSFVENSYESLTTANIKEAKFIIADHIDDAFMNIIVHSCEEAIIAVNNIDVTATAFVKQLMIYSVIDKSNSDSIQTYNWCVLSKSFKNISQLQSFEMSYDLKDCQTVIKASPKMGDIFLGQDLLIAFTESKLTVNNIINAKHTNIINILQCYYEAENKGYSLRTFLKENGWLDHENKIAFYAIDEFGAMVYRICEKNGIHFSVFISDEDREIACKGHENSAVLLKCSNIMSVDKSKYTHIFAAIMWNQRQIDMLNSIMCNICLFDAIALNLYVKAFYVNRIHQILNSNPYIRVGIFITPSVRHIKGELTETEYYFKQYGCKIGAVCAIQDNNLREKFSKKIYKDYGFDEEYINEVCWASYPVIEQNGVKLFPNHTGKFSNIINHRRLTTDNPKNYKNTVYFFGDSCVTGLNVGDRETIESAFQRILNKNNLPYLVQNCANSWGRHYDWIFTLTDTMQFNPGDILLFCSEVDFLTQLQIKSNNQKTLKNILGIDTFSLFNRPHDYGEVFSDDHHFNSKGNEVIAEKIFADLQAANYFSDDFVDTNIPCDETDGMPTNNRTDSVVTQYSLELNKYLDDIKQYRPKIGSIVMNCNPFTLGHRYLIEYAAKTVEKLYVFVVEEDKSIFPFIDRIELVKKGTSDLENVVILPSGRFMISSLTFQQYFEKGDLQDTVIDPSRDVEIFAKEIAPVMGITVRFAGEEPLDNVTRQYNASMKNILPQYGIEFVEIPRKEEEGKVISASRVRRLFETNDFDSIAKLVPDTTLEYLKRSRLSVTYYSK